MRAVQTNKTTSIVSSTRRNTVNNNYTCISLLGSPPSPQFEERWFGGLLCSSTEGSTKSSRSRQKSWNRWKSGKANGSISKVVATSSSGRSISSNTCSAVGRHIRRNKLRRRRVGGRAHLQLEALDNPSSVGFQQHSVLDRLCRKHPLCEWTQPISHDEFLHPLPSGAHYSLLFVYSSKQIQ